MPLWASYFTEVRAAVPQQSPSGQHDDFVFAEAQEGTP
jgi:hypothetical protein